MARDYELTEAIHAGYLRVEARGVYHVDRTVRLLQHIAEAAQRHGADRVLLDHRGVSGNFSTIDRFTLGVAAAKLRIKLAVLARQETIDRFAELVARNRGLDARVISDEAAAIAWLLAD